MKHYKLKNLIEDLQNVSMTQDEKSEVFMRTWSDIEKIEAIHASSARKSRVAEVGHHGVSVTSTLQVAWYSYFMEKKFVPALSLALLLIATGGTSLAAESALPGDMLYSVKINLNEQIRGFTAVTPEAKAKFALEVTDRRLKEVALLSSKGLLNAKSSSIIQGQLLKQAGHIRNQVASLVATNNIRAAQEISLNFESSLRAHELILEKISNQSESVDNLALESSDVSSTSTSVQTAVLVAVDTDSINAHSASTTSSNDSESAISSTSILTLSATPVSNVALTKNTRSLIESLIATIKDQIATTTAARALLQAAEVGDSSLDKEKLAARLAEIRLKAVEIKRIASTTPVSSLTISSSALSYIASSDVLINSAARKIASSSYSSAILDLQKASRYLIDAETLISAEYSSDPTVKSIINDALSDSDFSQAGVVSSTTISTDISSTTATTTSSTTDSTSTEVHDREATSTERTSTDR